MILSPDGQYVAYSSCEDTGEAGFEIFVMKLDGTEKRKIVSNPCSKNKEVDSQDISWSPVLQPNRPQATQFYIYKNNQQFGPYDEQAVISWLQNGRLSFSDLAYKYGMNEWQPLGTLVQIPVTTSGNLETEFELFSVYAEELEDLFSQFKYANAYTHKQLLEQYEQKLQIMERQVYSLKGQFPDSDEVRFMESFFYAKSSGLKMEQNDWTESLNFLNRAISILDTPNVRIVRASVYAKLNQKALALQDLNHIIANPPDDEGLYFAARQMRDEL
jgi:tetratricopeptide (TPR) repeat protein